MKKPYVLELYESTERGRILGHRFFWRLRRRRGGQIVADGAEGYTRKADLRRAVDGLPLDWRAVEVVEADTTGAWNMAIGRQAMTKGPKR